MSINRVNQVSVRLLAASCRTDLSIPLDAKLLLQKLLVQEFGTEVDPSRISFVNHQPDACRERVCDVRL